VAPEKRSKPQVKLLPKSPTGIAGMDEITSGGLPKGRPTLIAGAAGCGKTLFAMEFLVNGVIQYNEPAVLVAFEENAEELAQNVASLGFDLKELIKQKKLNIDYVKIERTEIEEVDGRCRVTVSDSGKGFDVHATMDDPQTHGLLVVTDRLKLMGGTIDVESKPGDGTRVKIEIPITDSAI